jgi:general secretion pathway protein N
MLKSAHGIAGNRCLRYLRNALIGVALLGVCAAVLLWFLPARWVTPWIEPQLHGLRLQQVHGSLWNGQADATGALDGKQLGHLRWQLSRRALLGQMDMQLAFDGPGLTFSGTTRRLSDGRIEARDLSVHAQLAALDPGIATPWGNPAGELQVTASHVLLQGGWPLELQAQGQWRDAGMHTRDGDVALGELQLQAQAEGGVIQAQWHDDGQGPLQTTGELQLSPLGWRLDSSLRARQTDPALQHWLARLGPISADGSVHIQQSGGLAGSPPSTDKGTMQP